MADSQPANWPFPLDDPYPTYHAMRQEGPVHWAPELDAFLVLSYDLAFSILRGPEWSVDPRNSPALASSMSAGPAPDLWTKTLLFMDPPGHTRLRGLVNRSFSPKAVEALRPRVASVVEAALGDLAGRSQAELLDQLGYPVPLAVISELLDVGVEGAATLREETPALTAILEMDPDPKTIESSLAAAMRVMMLLVPLVAERRAQPGIDLLSQLAAACDDARQLEVDELMVTCMLLLAAGHETTANLVGNGTLALLRHPDQLELLRRRPELGRSAVEELLRFDSPVQLTARIALEDVQLAGHTVRKGEQALVLLGAANRDPRQFQDPDCLDITRSGARHLAFGSGAHFCLGASLARLEAEETLTRLVASFPEMRLRDSSPNWRPSTVFRRLASLPVWL